jgi:hypothetical protein
VIFYVSPGVSTSGLTTDGLWVRIEGTEPLPGRNLIDSKLRFKSEAKGLDLDFDPFYCRPINRVTADEFRFFPTTFDSLVPNSQAVLRIRGLEAKKYKEYLIAHRPADTSARPALGERALGAAVCADRAVIDTLGTTPSYESPNCTFSINAYAKMLVPGGTGDRLGLQAHRNLAVWSGDVLLDELREISRFRNGGNGSLWSLGLLRFFAVAPDDKVVMSIDPSDDSVSFKITGYMGSDTSQLHYSWVFPGANNGGNYKKYWKDGHWMDEAYGVGRNLRCYHHWNDPDRSKDRFECEFRTSAQGSLLSYPAP